MSLISYAQNYEDVMLLRALRNITSGFYIDIGAQDPVNDSVTKAFYERGWHGINIEPVSHWFGRLSNDRVHDINLQVAVSDNPGHLRFYEVENSGLSTTDPEFAKQHVEAGLRVTETDVRCVTLDSICDAHSVRDVHFLKVDCEGAEAAVFRGFSFRSVRPWIILVEATEPNTQKPAYADWDPILIEHGYRYVYEDGLNRFYVAEEHNELCAAFAYPPNVFDRFVRAPEATAQRRLQDAESQLGLLTNAERCIRAELERDSLVHQNAELHSTLSARNTEIDRLNSLLTSGDAEIGRLHHEVALRDHRIIEIEGQLTEYQRSTSWLITAPLRLFVKAIRAGVRQLRLALFRLLRTSARSIRPLLLLIAKWSWSRFFLRSLLGADSRSSNKLRAFLYGKGPERDVSKSAGVHRTLAVNWDATEAEKHVRSMLYRAWRRKGWRPSETIDSKGEG